MKEIEIDIKYMSYEYADRCLTEAMNKWHSFKVNSGDGSGKFKCKFLGDGVYQCGDHRYGIDDYDTLSALILDSFTTLPDGFSFMMGREEFYSIGDMLSSLSKGFSIMYVFKKEFITASFREGEKMVRYGAYSDKELWFLDSAQRQHMDLVKRWERSIL